MQITISVDEQGRIALNCSEDKPWLLVHVLRQVIERVEQRQIQQEAQAGPALVMPHGPLNGLRK